jgi:hypothetical protein
MRTVSRLAIASCLLLVAIPALSATIWTDWTSSTNGTPGSASGALGSVTVSYAGEVIATIIDGTAAIYWQPDSTWIGGAVDTSPSTVGDTISLMGLDPTATNTITFSSPVSNPVFAFWSLGGSGPPPATFTFDATPVLQAGGPNAAFGGSSITVVGNVVSGMEGNGTVMFVGTFTSISWTNTFENFYAFTVGTAGNVPEPEMLALFGVAALILMVARERRTS